MVHHWFAAKSFRIAAIAILITATLCRSGWASQLAQHESAPLADPVEVAIEHGHYHPPKLDHLHDDTSGISDADHPLIHAVLALDLPFFFTRLPERSLTFSAILFPMGTPSPLTALPKDLYRPPRKVS